MNNMRNNIKETARKGLFYILTSLPLGGLGWAFTSCSDFSDYNDTPVDQMASSGQTLWENISQNSQLSDFAALVQRAGYVDQLNTPRALTVWAPLNGTFSRADYESLSTEDLLNQFVLSHVAEYTHTASGLVDERVHTLNEKSFTFAGNGSYTFDGISISQANLPNSNGLMHLLGGVAKYYPNLYQYLFTAEGIDLLREFFKQYELTFLDESASVKGPMVNGVQTYIDSVRVTYNTMTMSLNAYLELEDSSYTFLMPTDDAFTEMYNRVKPYYRYLGTTLAPDLANYTAASSTNTKPVTVDAAYMSDSLTKRVIMRNLFYSNNDVYNQWVVDKGIYTDTLRSTTRTKFSNPREILGRTVGEPVEMSNGYARLVDSLAFLSWEAYCPEISVNPRNYLGALFPVAAQSYRNQSLPDSLVERVFGPESGITNYRYLWIAPGGERTKPEFFITLPNVMSTTYNFYVVFLPSAWPEIGGDARPNWLNFQLHYCNDKGAMATYNFSRAYADSLRTGGTLPNVPTAVNANTAFTNDPAKTDTMFIGQFTFPVAYRGLGDADFGPAIHVTTPISVFNANQLATYSRDIRIAAILMRPVELDEYEANNK